MFLRRCKNTNMYGMGQRDSDKMQLSGFDIDAFLREDWQQRPRLFRGAFADWRNPVEPDELAGLALEPEVESRLIERESGAWHVEDGPLPEDRFAQLGANPWTLLVQAADHHIPDVAALIEPFRFVPNWRIDDVMVSYASDGGGVGAHYDHYDVFLIQGAGQRRWRIGQKCDEASALIPHNDLRLLAEFEATEEWILEPGDMLYVPPGTAHEGTAIGDDCMTYSIGFRAPSAADLVDGFSAHLLDMLTEDDRYSDTGLPRQANPGEITPRAIDGLRQKMLAQIGDRDAFIRWFGQQNSAPKNAEIDWRPDEAMTPPRMRSAIASRAVIIRNPASRFAFAEASDGCVILFVDGAAYDCQGECAAFARQLCATASVGIPHGLAASDTAVTLITALYNRGSIAWDE